MPPKRKRLPRPSKAELERAITIRTSVDISNKTYKVFKSYSASGEKTRIVITGDAPYSAQKRPCVMVDINDVEWPKEPVPPTRDQSLTKQTQTASLIAGSTTEAVGMKDEVMDTRADSNIDQRSGCWDSSFTGWFSSQGGVVDTKIIGFKEFEEYGRGTVALQDIEEGTKLFTLPRSLTLSTRTCQLPSLLNDSHQTWTKFQLHKGWVGLILCMLWEDAKGSQGKWGGYLNSLPTTFDTPMFWSEVELLELKGGCIEDKIGKVEAEKDYLEKLLPAVKSRPDVFSPSQIEAFYTIERYHMMGTRILSRSFNVEAAEGDNEEPSVESVISNPREPHSNSDMDVDSSHEAVADNDGQGSNSDGSSDSDDEDDPRDVAMVPFADILNARYGCANAKLFYEEQHLGMIAIKPIKAGEQIWNTYGDLPNSDLLRRYGHIDLFPLDDGGLGSPADIAEVRADLVAQDTMHKLTEEEVKERVDWWLEEGGDDGFIIDASYQLPDMLVSFVRLLMDTSAWEAARDRGKVPKPKADMPVREACKSVLQKRLSLYPTTLKDDQAILKELSKQPANGDRSLYRRKCAIHVRIGEKRVLTGALELLKKVISEDAPKTERGKRKPSGEIQREASHKKRR